jgi:hypothetical protein
MEAGLPRPGDPYVTKDGEVIQPDSRADIGLRDTKPWDVKPADFRALKRQNLKDIPAETSVINACAVALTYTMLGISDREIQLTMKITEDQLERIREHEIYTTVYEAFKDELINVNSASLHARIAGMAHESLTNVIHLANTATKEDTKLRANTDLLDRAGTRIADQAERNKSRPSGLRIIVTKKGEDTAFEVTTGIDEDV